MAKNQYTKQIQLVNPGANIDADYGPFDTVALANAAIDPAIRAGRTVAIGTTTLVEYTWHPGNVTDAGLVVKNNLSAKQDTLVSGTNIKTVNGSPVLGAGDIVIPKGDPGAVGPSGGSQIPFWIAAAYPAGEQRNYLGKDWYLPAGVSALSTDVPGTSSKWVDRLPGVKTSVSVLSLPGKEPNYDTTTKRFTIYNGTTFIPSGGVVTNYATTADTVLDLSSSSIVWYIFINKTTKIPEAYVYTDGLLPGKLIDPNLILFATISQGNSTIHITGAYRINSNLFGINLFPQVSVSAPVGKEPNLDTTAGTLTIYNATTFIPTIGSAVNYSTTADIALNISSFAGIWYVFMNKTTRVPEAYAYTDAAISTKLNDANLLLFALVSNGANKFVTTSGPYKINSNLYGVGSPRLVQPVLLSGAALSKSGFSYIFSGNVGILQGNGQYGIINAGTYTLSALDCLVASNIDKNKRYDGSGGVNQPKITPVIKGFSTVTENDLVLAWRGGNNDMQSIWDGLLNQVAAPYSKVDDRVVYANKLFLFDDEPIAIHKDSLFVNAASSKKCKVSVLSAAANGLQRLDIDNPLLLNASSLGATAEILIEQTDDKTVTVKKTVNIKKANKAAKSGLTRNILMFGDSLTQGNNGLTSSPIYQVRNRISALGMTATMVGSFNIETQAADAIGNYRGEGRGYWQYLNFVGMSNNPYGNVITPKFTGGGTTKFQNPFLRLATGADTTAHPTWCFRNTGVQNELSYSTDPVKTGNFYIFDFANYLTVQAIPPPDIITIALGTNDWQENLANDLNKSVTACEIMVTKIREALPSVKILIVPANALSIARAEWTTHFAVLAEKVITKIETLFSADANIHTLPLFAHSSRWASVASFTSQGVISADNNFTSYTVSSDVHALDNATGEGMESYMDALLPAIVYCY